jgi:hypothetical protein
MSKHNGMSYRGITQKTAEWIGMAASVAGGYIAVDGPRLRRTSAADVQQMQSMVDASRDRGFDEPDLLDEIARLTRHDIHGGDYCVIGDEGDDHLILVVPAGGPLATEGYSLPASLIEELLPLLSAAGYAT